MKIQFLFLLLICTLGSGIARAEDMAFYCRNSSGASDGPLRSWFDSTIPSLRQEIYIISENKIEEKRFISPNSVCGLPINFAKECQGSVRWFQGSRIYSFLCRNGIEGKATYSYGWLDFKCTGPDVTSDFQTKTYYRCEEE